METLASEVLDSEDVKKNTALHKYISWLIDDQYTYGEFGRHEIVNPTETARTIETSQIKPNIFSSILACSTLIAVNGMTEEVKNTFETWLEEIRSESGYWTSASGSKLPYASQSGWAESTNLRHTAKCLDYYLLTNKFSYEDASIFYSILETQLESGGFPQFNSMQEDLWSTAYFVNLLIRATDSNHIDKVISRGQSPQEQQIKLENTLNRAIEWLLSKLNDKFLWHADNSDDITVTIAMMIEIGGYLAIHKPKCCNAIVDALINQTDKRPSLAYVGCLTFDALGNKTQSKIVELLQEILYEEYIVPRDLIEATSLCRLLFIGSDTKSANTLTLRVSS